MPTQQPEDSRAAPGGAGHPSPGRRWPRWRAAGCAISFRCAVPARRDRRELRRRLRLAARAARAEQARVTANELQDLSAKHAPVARLCAGPVADSEVLELAGGHRFLLTVRDATMAVRRLEKRAAAGGVRFAGVQSCFGHCWYRLRFDSSGGPEEVVARVVPFTGRVAPACRPPREDRPTGGW